jgi:hypothetical protein
MDLPILKSGTAMSSGKTDDLKMCVQRTAMFFVYFGNFMKKTGFT